MFSQAELTGCEFKTVFTETTTLSSIKFCSLLTPVLVSSMTERVYMMIIIQPTNL